MLLCGVFFFFNPCPKTSFFHWFLGRGRERKRDISWLPSPTGTDQGSKLKPGCVPQPGIKATTFLFKGWHSNQATLARESTWYLLTALSPLSGVLA